MYLKKILKHMNKRIVVSFLLRLNLNITMIDRVCLRVRMIFRILKLRIVWYWSVRNDVIRDYSDEFFYLTI